MTIPTGFVTNKDKLLDIVMDKIMEYILSLPQPPPSLEDPLALLPQLNSLPRLGEDLNGNVPQSLYDHTMAMLEDSDSDSEPLSMDFLTGIDYINIYIFVINNNYI